MSFESPSERAAIFVLTRISECSILAVCTGTSATTRRGERCGILIGTRMD